MAEGFLLGPDLLSRTRRTIEAVEGGILRSGFRAIPTALEGDVSSSQKVFRVCTFTGAWSMGGIKTVTFKFAPGATNTVNATNLFASVPAPAGSGDCAIAREGNSWFLIAAVCSTST